MDMKNAIVTDRDEVLELVVNRDCPIAKVILAGNYNRVDPVIDEINFPRTGSGIVKIPAILVDFGESMKWDKVSGILTHRNLRGADPQELFAFGEKYPTKQMNNPIIALNALWNDEQDDPTVMLLSREFQSRFLGLCFMDEDGWLSWYRALAFPL